VRDAVGARENQHVAAEHDARQAQSRLCVRNVLELQESEMPGWRYLRRAFTRLTSSFCVREGFMRGCVIMLVSLSVYNAAPVRPQVQQE
jgi:hypothetical protein